MIVVIIVSMMIMDHAIESVGVRTYSVPLDNVRTLGMCTSTDDLP